MNRLYRQLFQDKFLILVLSLSLISFIGLYIAETYFSIAPRLAEVIQGFASVLLTSFVVGLFFE
jgi:hypothetical protein